jgi:hypothetical protein
VICDLNRLLFEKTMRVFYPTPGAAVVTYVDHTLNMRHFDEQSTFNLVTFGVSQFAAYEPIAGRCNDSI